MNLKNRLLTPLGTLMILLAICAGCGKSADDRIVEIAQQSLREQSRQNERLIEQSNHLAEAASELVEADGQARQEFVQAHQAMQNAIQDERTNLDRQREELEAERQQLAHERRIAPVIAESIATVGLTLAALLPLALAAYVLHVANRRSAEDEHVCQVLIEDWVARESRRPAISGRSGSLRLLGPRND